ncbi:hypothetical protein Gogos_002230 [Gossypium gossypioides]|uniref:Uncharacterized protein n=1 Tax=Gossypium gossypioides TaxID=34282 RepID=A0A7J9CQR4_GOSGO|nr:hypothetical protein [Gossypium gossypioides]
MQKCWGYNGSKLVIHEADEELNRFPDNSEKERDIKILERNYKRRNLGHRVDDKVDAGDGPNWIGVCMEKWYENTKFTAKQIWPMQSHHRSEEEGNAEGKNEDATE